MVTLQRDNDDTTSSDVVEQPGSSDTARTVESEAVPVDPFALAERVYRLMRDEMEIEFIRRGWR